MKLEIISKVPLSPNNKSPLLFVHGAWHGAWCWDVHFLDYFAHLGYEVHALSLRGHGNSEGRDQLRWSRISHYVEDVALAAKQMRSSPIVIGHSMGGFVVQKYLELHDAPAAVLMASVPPSGVWATTLKIAQHHPLIFAKMNLTFSLYPLISTPELARQYFFSDELTDERATNFWKKLQDESYLSFLDMLVLDLPKPEKVNTNMLVIGAENDAIFSNEEIHATASAYNCKAEMFPDMAHDMMLEPRWQLVADRIVQWLLNSNQV
jgi:pimeloyl-ACP methyl ester carboxylesterase